MAIDPEIVGTVIGSAIVAIGFGGKYIHTKYSATLKKDNGNGGPRFCAEHRHMVESVTKLCGEVKDGFGDMHDKINATREAVARIEGMLQRSRN